MDAVSGNSCKELCIKWILFSTSNYLEAKQCVNLMKVQAGSTDGLCGGVTGQNLFRACRVFEKISASPE
jgi:hypothetical protein